MSLSASCSTQVGERSGRESAIVETRGWLEALIPIDSDAAPEEESVEESPDVSRHRRLQADRYYRLDAQETEHLSGKHEHVIAARMRALEAVYPPRDDRIDTCRDALWRCR